MAKQVDYNDFWYIQDNPITKAGVYPYLGRQIDPSLEPDKVYMVLRPAEEIEKAKETFKLIPLVDEHTMLGADFTPAEKKGIHGVTGEQTTFKNGVLYTPIKIYSEFLKDEIENGKKELSCGYFCKYDLTPGEYNGVHYDAVQRDLRGNHIALVDNGRMGHDVRVMDSMCFACDSMDIGEIRHSVFNQNEKELTKEDKGENMQAQDFDESKVKRDSDGKFSSTGGGAKGDGKSNHSDFSTLKGKVEIGEPISESLLKSIYNEFENAEKETMKEGLSKEEEEKALSNFKEKKNAWKNAEKYAKEYGYKKEMKAGSEKGYKGYQIYREKAEARNGNPLFYVFKGNQSLPLKGNFKTEEEAQKYIDDLSSKNHGNSGEDAATGKENEQMDKREIIREIMAVAAKPADQFQGGEEEKVETIAKLAEKIAYNPSEAEKADDEELLKKEEGLEEVKDEGKGCDEEEKDMEKVEEIKEKLSAEDSMKAVLKMLGKREALYTSLKPIIGAFDHADMTEESMAKYAAKKLNIAVDSGDDVCAVVKGYLKGAARKAEELVTFASDKAVEEKDNGFEQFMKGDK